MAVVYLCRKISQLSINCSKLVMVFYFEGPELKHCDYNRINGEEDILKYFKEKKQETIIHQAEITVKANPFKKYTRKAILNSLKNSSSALIRCNTEWQKIEKYTEYKKDIIESIPDILLFQSIIPPKHFSNDQWFDILYNKKKNKMLILEKYMRRRWVEEYGLTIIEPLGDKNYGCKKVD